MIALTGAAGFIGGHIVLALGGSGARMRLHAGPDSDPRTLSHSCLRGDIGHGGLLDELFEGADVAIHAAGPPSVARSFLEPAEYTRVHAVGTAHVLEACVRQKVRRIVFISSAEVYGNQTPAVVDESQPMVASSPYGAAKMGAEQLVRVFALANKIEAVVLRPFLVYGPGMPPEGVVSEFLARGAKREAILVRNRRPIRDFCFAPNVADAIRAACGVAVEDRFTVANIGSGLGTRIGELADMVARMAGVPRVEDVAVDDRPAGADVDCLIANIERAGRVLGWHPTTSLEQGLQTSLDWMRAA